MPRRVGSGSPIGVVQVVHVTASRTTTRPRRCRTRRLLFPLIPARQLLGGAARTFTTCIGSRGRSVRSSVPCLVGTAISPSGMRQRPTLSVCGQRWTIRRPGGTRHQTRWPHRPCRPWWVFGDVGDPEPVGTVHPEAAVHQVSGRLGVVGVPQRGPAVPVDADNAVDPHEVLDTFA